MKVDFFFQSVYSKLKGLIDHLACIYVLDGHIHFVLSNYGWKFNTEHL